MLVSVLNSISILVVILQQKEYFKTLGFLNIKKSLFWIDFSYIIVNLLVGIYMFEFWLQGYGDYINDIKNQRYLNCAGIFLIYLKGSFYLSLIDAIAPLIDIMRRIAFDIRYFVFILLVYGFGFAFCFNIIGKS